MHFASAQYEGISDQDAVFYFFFLNVFILEREVGVILRTNATVAGMRGWCCNRESLVNR